MIDKTKYNPGIHHRHSIRLREYDYSQAGLYFVTICCQNRECLLGAIENNKMILNDAGGMVNKCWIRVLNDFINTKLHEYIIMPNHFHAIIEIIPITIVGADSISAPSVAPTTEPVSVQNAANINRADMESAPTGTGGLSKIIQSFKRHTTIEYIKMVKQNILPPFDKRIWQRNYYEHIVRDENELKRIREYIQNNPINWKNDDLNVEVTS